MSKLIEANETEFFKASMDDVRTHLSTDRWAFIRGLLVGFLASFPIVYAATNGDFLLSL